MFLTPSARSGAVMLLEGECALTYGQAEAFCARFAQAARRRGVMLCLCENSVGTALGIMAALSARAVPLLLNAQLPAPQLERLLALYRPEYLWLPENQAEALKPVMAKALPGCKPALLFKEFGQALVTTGCGSGALHDDLALLLSSSGSTGSPKLVRISYGNLRANADAIRESLGLDSSERAITSLPLNYSYGLSVLTSHLCSGASVILTKDSVIQRGFWQCFREHGATSLAGVPYTYEILKKLRFPRMELPSLRSLTQAGGHLSALLQQEFSEYARLRKVRLYVMYGATEATARMTCLSSEQSGRLGSAGKAVPGGRIWLEDENGVEIRAPGVTGRLFYAGPNVSLGYACKAEDLAKGDERHGVLDTGDLACLDAEGYLYVKGRASRFLKLYGNRVSLDEAEALLRARYPKLDLACGGRDDQLIVYASGSADTSEIVSFLAQETGISPKAFALRTVSEIPRTASGKIRYAQLAEDKND